MHRNEKTGGINTRNKHADSSLHAETGAFKRNGRTSKVLTSEVI